MARSAAAIACAWMIAAACGSNDEGLFGASGGQAGDGASGGSSGGQAGAPADASLAGASNGGIAGQASGGGAGAAGKSGGGGAPDDASAGSGGSGGAATPGTIQCGAAPCATSFNVCCTCPACTIPYPTTCFPIITGCTGTGQVMTCDDAADCNGGVCCAHFKPPKFQFTGATCETNCPEEGNAQLCTVTSECPDGRVCKDLASLPGFRACQPK